MYLPDYTHNKGSLNKNLSIFFEGNRLILLKDNIKYKVNLAEYSKKLFHASEKEKYSYELYNNGVHWEKLDEDLSIDGIIRDALNNNNYENISNNNENNITFNNNLNSQKIEENINLYKNGYLKYDGLKPTERYSSFDYCYNYFQNFRYQNEIEQIIDTKKIEMSCLQLGFYLASWGMFRGSTQILYKSSSFYQKILKFIVEYKAKEIWETDVSNYKESVNLITDFVNEFKSEFKKYDFTDTLISKIMLGIFGNIPAFDKNFYDGFQIGKINRQNLIKISDFYFCYREQIDKYSNEFKTFDFLTEQHTKIKYSKAKIIDMIGFIEGLKINYVKKLKSKKG